MKMPIELKSSFYFFLILCSALIFSCTTEDTDDTITADPIVGKWFLTKVNETNVADVDCYRESFLDSNGEKITFFLQDRLENGDCETVLNNTQDLTNEDGFYYLGDEVIEIYIEGKTLSWRVDLETSLEFQK